MSTRDGRLFSNGLLHPSAALAACFGRQIRHGGDGGIVVGTAIRWRQQKPRVGRRAGAAWCCSCRARRLPVEVYAKGRCVRISYFIGVGGPCRRTRRTRRRPSHPPRPQVCPTSSSSAGNSSCVLSCNSVSCCGAGGGHQHCGACANAGSGWRWQPCARYVRRPPTRRRCARRAAALSPAAPASLSLSLCTRFDALTISNTRSSPQTGAALNTISNLETTSVSALLFFYVAPLWALVFGVLLLRESLHRRTVIAVALAVTGVALLFVPSVLADGAASGAGHAREAASHTSSLHGDVLGLLSGLAMAGYVLHLYPQASTSFHTSLHTSLLTSLHTRLHKLPHKPPHKPPHTPPHKPPPLSPSPPPFEPTAILLPAHHAQLNPPSKLACAPRSPLVASSPVFTAT